MEGLAATLNPAAHAYLELLANRREAEATRFLRHRYEQGAQLRSIYADVLAAALGEADRRHALGVLSTARRRFVNHATERIMSVFESALLHTRAPHGRAVCASFGPEVPELQIRIAAALLAVDGYDVCHLGPNPSLDDFECVLDQSDPRLVILFANGADGVVALARAAGVVRAKQATQAPLIVVGGAGVDAQSPRWRRSGGDLHARSALEAVALATQYEVRLQERA